MEHHQSVSLTSSWNVQGPYDINSILQSRCEDESSHLPPASPYSIKLVLPTSSANDDDNDNTPACQLVLSCQSRIAVRSIEVISNARHVELYDNLDSYCCTVRGARQEQREGDQQTGLILYAAKLTVDSPVQLCRLKFVSLTDKCQLTLSRLMVTFTRTEGESYAGSVGGRSIDMGKVRDIMASLQQPIPPNVQSLMQTVEQYQKNQASVLDDFQQTATARLSTLSSNDPEASVASSNIVGMLSAVSKASALQQAARARAARAHTATRTSGTVAPSESAELSNQSGAADNKGVSQVGNGSSQQLNVDSLSKLMTSFGVGRSPAGIENTETGGFADSHDMLNALQTMCKGVNHMRAADRQAAERSYGPEKRGYREDHASNAESVRQVDKSPHTNGMVELEQRLMGYVVAMEKRVMGKLDRQIELLCDHIDLRFNKLEALLEGKGSCVSVNAAKDSELISEEVD